MAKDHGLGDGDRTVDVAQGLELLLLAVAQHIVLLDGVQCFLLPLQFDNVGVGDDALGEIPHRLFKRGREEQHLARCGKHPGVKGRKKWVGKVAWTSDSMQYTSSLGLIPTSGCGCCGPGDPVWRS